MRHNHAMAITFCLLLASCGRCGPCPVLAPASPDFCKGGLIFSGVTDECGCEEPPVCMMPECGDCPMFMPPGPDFCKNGSIIDGGKDLCGCQMPPRCLGEKECLDDLDCACGRHIVSDDCFVGNNRFVNSGKQCPDYCTGIDGNIKVKCLSGECRLVRQ